MAISITRHPAATEFHCERCDKPKKSKLIGTWARDDDTLTICNGCYGWLNANGEKRV